MTSGQKALCLLLSVSTLALTMVATEEERKRDEQRKRVVWHGLSETERKQARRRDKIRRDGCWGDPANMTQEEPMR